VRLEEHLVLELIVRFELLVPKGGLRWILQALVGLSESLNINFLNPQSR
jgi:hypothetical protein